MSSSAEVVSKATQILSAIEYHIDNDNCEHCKALLKSAGLPGQQETTSTRTGAETTLRFNQNGNYTDR